jgi:hypothetical protein
MKYVLPDDDALLTKKALMRPANEILKEAKRLLRGCQDADVTFMPVDPQAHDAAATHAEEMGIAWTLGHIIAHMTAGVEESAALAAELARGVPFHGRSRYETPWQTVTTVQQCRSRLEESRRMRLASLGMWPERPDLSLTNALWDGAPEYNAIQRYMVGLRHEAGHLDQIRNAVAQARAYRRQQTWWWRWFHPRARRKGSGSLPGASETRILVEQVAHAEGAPEADPAPVPADEAVLPIDSGLSDYEAAQ